MTSDLIPRIKILVVVPHNGYITAHTMRSLDLIKNGNGLEFRISKHHGSVFIADNRNDQCYGKDGLDNWADYFLFIDSDIEFTLAHIHAMVERNVDICSVSYCFKEDILSDYIVAGNWIPGYPGISEKKKEFRRSNTTGFVCVDWVGAGFLLVKKSAMEKMTFPWFYHPVMPVPPGSGPYPQKSVGEDIGFCLRAREAGIKIYIDCNIHIGHKKGDVMENKDQNQKQTLPKSYASMALQLNQKNSEIITKMAMDYDSVVAMIQSKEEEIENLKVKLAEKESEISKLTSPVKEESTSA